MQPPTSNSTGGDGGPMVIGEGLGLLEIGVGMHPA
jgi:hypothetical protein